MARVPTAKDLGAAQLRGAGGAAQLNLNVAKETGAAGGAMGRAIASAGNAIGDAIGSLAAAAKASGDKFALPEAQLELETRLTEYDRNAYGNAGEDGSGLYGYTDGAKGIVQEVYEKYGSRMDPDDQRRFQIKAGYNILGRSTRAIEQSQRLAVGYADKKEGQLYASWTERLAEGGGWANDEQVQGAWSAIRDSVNARVGHTYTEDQAKAREQQLLGDFTAKRLAWLAENDPAAFDALSSKASKGIVDENAERQVETGRPQSQRMPSVQPSDVIFSTSRVPTSSERRSIFRGGGVVVNLDTNWAKGNQQTSPLVVIPDGATKEQRAAAQAYANEIAKVYEQQFGKSLRPRVLTRSQNGRGRAYTMHTEPYSVNDTKAVDFFNSDEGRKVHADILQRTLGQIPGVKFAIPHNPSKGDKGAHGPRGNEVDFAKALIGQLGGQDMAGATGPGGSAKPSGGRGVNLTAYSPQRGGDAMEGGYAAARPGPDGKNVVRTLADVASGQSDYVTIAGNPSEYGNEYVIPEISFVTASGETKTLKNVRAVVHDTGSAFKDAPQGRYDVPIDKDASNKQMQQSHAMWKKAGIEFVPKENVQVAAAQPETMTDALPSMTDGDMEAWVERGIKEGVIEREQAEGLRKAGVNAMREWMEQNTSGPTGDVEDGEEESVSGDPSPAELARRLGVQAAIDEETGQAKVAFGKETADQLMKIVEDDPDGKVSQYLNDNEKAALEEAGIDVENITVSQAFALAQEAANQQGVQIAQKGSGVPVAGGDPMDPFLGGRLLKGQTFSVKAAGGKTLTFSSEMLNAVDPKAFKAIRKAASERQKALIKEQRYMADEMMDRQIATIERTGEGAEKFDMRLIEQVYKGTKKLGTFKRQAEVAQRSFEAKKGIEDLPDEQIMSRLDELEGEIIDKDGDADPVIAKVYERTKKHMEKVMDLRRTDPARAVENSREVRKYVEAMVPNGRFETSSQMYGLIDARIQAQTKLGIHPTPITKREADKLLEPLVRAGSLAEKREKAKELSRSLREVYREHAETVMNAALYLNKRDTEDDRLTLNQTFRSLAAEADKPSSTFQGRGTGRGDLERANPFSRYDR